MVDTPRMMWGPAAGLGTAAALTTTPVLNDSDNALACIFIAPEAGTIDAIGVRCATRTGTPPSYSVGLFTVDTTTGAPTTTNYGGSATKSYDFTATGYHWITLDTPASATRGELIAAVIKPGGTAPDASNSVALLHRGGVSLPENFPTSKDFTTAWQTNGALPLIAARYTDGEIAGGTPLNATAVSVNYNSNSTPDEVGNLFQVEFDCSIDGLWLWTVRVASITMTVKLYDNGGSTLATKTIDVDAFGGPGLTAATFFPFDADVSLTANTSYRATVVANETTNRQYVEWTFPEAASRIALPDGLNWQKTSRTDAGGWTEDTTKIVLMALRLKTIDVAGGGGTTVYGPGPRIARPLSGPAGQRW